MFSFLILFSLLAGLLTQISRVPHESKCVRFIGQHLLTNIDWRPAMSFQLAIWRTTCPLAAVYKAGAPPGLLTVMLDHVLRIFEQPPRYRPAASV